MIREVGVRRVLVHGMFPDTLLVFLLDRISLVRQFQVTPVESRH